MTAPTNITVWDVEHGVCIYAETPNKKRVILDCGTSPDFSPSMHLHDKLGIKKIDYLVISHPHDDHINDINNLLYYYENDIELYRRNEKISKDIVGEENPDVVKAPNDKKINQYFKLDEKFVKGVEWNKSPRNPTWGIGCTFYTYSNDDKELKINNQSVVTFIEFDNEKILYGGDLEEKGWLELLQNEEFVKRLKNTTILIASHHGNESGYCSDIFKHFTPKLTVVSAGKYRDFDAASKYDEKTDGMLVFSKTNGTKHRKVISTRNDGNIEIKIYDDKETKVTID